MLFSILFRNRYFRSWFPRTRSSDPITALTDLGWSAVGPVIDDIKSVLHIEAHQAKGDGSAYGLLILYQTEEHRHDPDDFLDDTYARNRRILQRSFPKSQLLGTVSIGRYSEAEDLYGNTSNVLAISMTISRPAYERVNWDNTNLRNLHMISTRGNEGIDMDIHPSLRDLANIM